MSRELDEAARDAYHEHRDAVWGVCYRMMGSVSDADELAQETFLRLQERPPEDLERSLRSWLVTVATNLCRDELRKRDRQNYTGEWLPAPVEVDTRGGWFARESRQLRDETPERQMRRLESVSYAFLVALEALSPKQRAVLLLRDVYDFSVRETANALQLSVSNGKTTHHRARNRLDQTPDVDDVTADRDRTQLVEHLVESLVTQDYERLADLLTDDVEIRTDGGDGEFVANTRRLEGRDTAVRFMKGINEKSRIERMRVEQLNGAPALLVEVDPAFDGQAPRTVIQYTFRDGRIAASYVILASDKVHHLFED